MVEEAKRAMSQAGAMLLELKKRIDIPPFAIEYLLSVRWRKPAENICIARSSSSLCTRYLHNQQSSALILL